jgi:hypothetical protein
MEDRGLFRKGFLRRAMSRTLRRSVPAGSSSFGSWRVSATIRCNVEGGLFAGWEGKAWNPSEQVVL